MEALEQWDGLGLWGPLWIQAGWVSACPAHLLALCLAEDPTFRCDECDELFQCKLDLRRHKKYACSSAGAPLYEGLGEELKPEGLSGGSDGQAHECKDCERMFPNKYRCHPTPTPTPSSWQLPWSPAHLRQSWAPALGNQGLMRASSLHWEQSGCACVQAADVFSPNLAR